MVSVSSSRQRLKVFRARRIRGIMAGAPAFVVAGERVVDRGEATRLAADYPSAQRVDLGAVTVLPGFNDAHQHLSMVAADEVALDASPGRYADTNELLAAIAARAREAPAGAWVRVARYDEARTFGRRLDRTALDRVAPDHPVRVAHMSAHQGIANTPALTAAGIDGAMTDPLGGRLGRADGRLDGWLYEQAYFAFAYTAIGGKSAAVPAPSARDHAAGMRRVIGRFNAMGLTSVTDAMVGGKEHDAYRQVYTDLTVRVTMLPTYAWLDDIAGPLPLTALGDHWLRFGPTKIFVDGAVSARTCLVEQGFTDAPEDHGIALLDPPQLEHMARTVVGRGDRLAVHANGDRAITWTLDALAAAGHDARGHRIEHCSIVNDLILERMARMRVAAVPFGSYARYHGAKLRRWYGDERLERMFAHRSFRDAGVTVAGASDFPCGPVEPLYALQSCVTRRDESGASIGASQRLTLDEAVDVYTRGSAAAAGEAGVKGELSPGMLADFVVLGADLARTPADELAAVPVTSTWVGGRQVWPHAQPLTANERVDSFPDIATAMRP